MEKIKILIAEDDMLTAKNIAEYLESEGFEIVAMVDNGEDAVRMARELHPDIAILDIGLGEGNMDGIEVAGKINRFIKIPVIFLTAYADKKTIDRAATALPASYLIKPVNDSQLMASIHIAMTKYASSIAESTSPEHDKAPDYFFNNSNLFVKADRFVKLDTNKILCIEASGNYINITTAEHKYAVLSSLVAFYDQLQKINPDFVRIHRSYVINTQLLDSFDHLHAVVAGKEFPIGKSFREHFFGKLGYRK
jgi:DNA-binding LytR/AlgR family response regulator